MTNAASYIYSAYEFILELPLDKILDVGNHSKDGNPIPSFEEDVLIDLCLEAQKLFQKEDNVLEIEGDLVIVGDIHGSFHDLLRILNYIEENHLKALFLGDYVDRGGFSLECITLLFAFKVLKPDNYYLIRGNHEFDALCSQYGFKDEIVNTIHIQNPSSDAKEANNNKTHSDPKKVARIHHNPNCFVYTEKLYDAFIDAFSYLPICAIANSKTFCIHGGLCPKLKTIECARKIVRPIKKFEECEMLTNALWSDPYSSKSHMYTENQRGHGYLFNIDVVYSFLKNNSLQRVVRAHQCVTHGFQEYFHSLCITVFSASSYARDMGNYSGILKLNQKDDKIEFIKFFPLHQIKKNDAVFYKVKTSSICNDANKPKCFLLPHLALAQSKLGQNKNVNKIPFVPMNGESECQKVIRLQKHLIFSKPRKTNPILKINSLNFGRSMKYLGGNPDLKNLIINDSINKFPALDIKQEQHFSDDGITICDEANI